MSEFDLTGRTALVTGGTRGIGRAVADGLARAGATVIIHGRAAPPEKTPHRVVCSDLSDPDGVKRLVGALGDLSVLDILVNNAGYEVEEDSLDLNLDEWHKTMAVNLLSPVLLIGQLSPLLLQSRNPSVINVTSIHEEDPYPRHLAYSVSKAALAMATRVLALELAERRIRVNAIAPGVIETDINRHTIEQVGRKSFEQAVPLRRTGTPKDVAGAAVYLASDAASYVTGATLYVDGAYHISIVRY